VSERLKKPLPITGVAIKKCPPHEVDEVVDFVLADLLLVKWVAFLNHNNKDCMRAI